VIFAIQQTDTSNLNGKEYLYKRQSLDRLYKPVAISKYSNQPSITIAAAEATATIGDRQVFSKKQISFDNPFSLLVLSL